MMTTKEDAPRQEIDEVEALLPWFAAGTLSRKDQARVEAALESDAELSRRYSLVREELAETIRLNETLGAPSARAMSRLFEKIDADAPARRASTASLSVTAWFSNFVGALSPRTLAYAGAVAILAIVLQAGVIANIVLNERAAPGNYRTVGVERNQTAINAMDGAYALIRFAPHASAEDITKFLQANKLVMAGGPAAGTGFFRVRVAATGLSKEELTRIVKQLQSDKVVGFAAVE